MQKIRMAISFPVALMVILLIFGQISLAKHQYFADDFERRYSQSLSEAPFVDYKIHDAGNFGFTITNQGIFGSGFLGFGSAPSFQYPYPDQAEYLFAGAVWVGAVVGSDTLVSVGADGWQFILELWPDPGEFPPPYGGAMVDQSEGTLQKYVAVLTDTLTDPSYVASDPTDGRPHVPLNIEVTQSSYVWNYTVTEDFAIIEYKIKNIGTLPLTEAYVGFYVDGDVLKPNAQTGYTDDICGFRESAYYNLGNCFFEYPTLTAWISDNNGRDDDGPLPQGCDFPALTGMRVLRTPSDSLNTNFNWWLSNGSAPLDWGPRQAGSTEDPFRDFGGHLGTPTGDKNKYYIMSHSEFDYDQLFSAVDQTAQGWLPPHASLAGNFADGFDTKYLLSFGPFDCEPGETLPFTVAYVAGDNFHTEPCDNFENLFDANNPEPFYNTLNFSDLDYNGLFAEWIYDNPGVDTDGDGYYGKFMICPMDCTIIIDTTIFNDEIVINSSFKITNADTFYYQGDGVPDFDPVAVFCGDVDLNGVIGLTDITSIIAFLYQGSAVPGGWDFADVNGSGTVNLIDITYIIAYLYQFGQAPDCQ